MMKKILNVLLMLFVLQWARAEVKMPAMFGDGMVLQQQTEAKLWGTAEAKSQVKITTGWNNELYKVKADADGRWSAYVSTPEAGGPYSIVIMDSKDTLKLENVLIGEVWFCSGQSNMEMPMKGFKSQPVDGANRAAALGKNPNIRLFTAARTSKVTPQYDIKGEWQEATPATIREFSATAYFFGRMLNEALDVPVGLIVAAWGGSACEAWMNPAWLKPEWLENYRYPMPDTDEAIPSKNRTASVLYNGMLHPFIGYSIKGAIWYQGEDNYDRASTYADQLSTMVSGWRKEWGIGDFPFYYCQIAPYEYGLITPEGKPVINSAFLREQQLKAESMIPNSGMAVLMDAGLRDCIHPRQKQVAGERLCYQALAKAYGVEGIVCDPPVYKSMEIKGDTIIITLDRNKMWPAGRGIFSSELFKVAGSDRVFHPAKAWIQQKHIYVKSEQVKHPVAVRYAFENWADGDLYGEEIPLSSFRSDDWEQ